MRRSAFTVLLILSCSAVANERPYTPPRLDTGQPDMQGVWVASNSTPLQRPPGFTTLVIDEAQAAKLLAALDARAEDRNTPTEPTEYFDAVEHRADSRRAAQLDHRRSAEWPDSRQRSLQAAHRRKRWRTCSRRWMVRSNVPLPSDASPRNRATADPFHTQWRQPASDRADRRLVRIRVGVHRRGAHRSPELETPAGSRSLRGWAIRSAAGRAMFSSSRPAASRRTIICVWHLRIASSFRRERSLRSASLALPRTGSTIRSWSRTRLTTRSRGPASRISCVATS